MKKFGIIAVAVIVVVMDLFLSFAALTVPIDGTVGILPSTVIMVCIMNGVTFGCLYVCKFLLEDCN